MTINYQHGITLVLAAISLSGCDRPVTTTDEGPATTNLAIENAQRGLPTLRIVIDSSPRRLYYFGTATVPGGLADLTNRLSSARVAAPGDTVLYVYTYPGTRGFDVIMALDAARVAGYKRVEAIADFSDDASFFARMRWKRWSQNLDELPDRRTAARDSNSHR